MLRVALIVVGIAVVAVGLVAAFFVVALRTKSPRLLGAVRRFNRGVINKLQRRTAGRPGVQAALIRHRGRTSGREYETPVVPFATDGGFLVSLPYGPDTDWLRNVLAAGSAVLVTDGKTLTVDRPEVVGTAEARDELPPGEQRTHRLFAVAHCLRLHLADTDTDTDTDTDPDAPDPQDRD